MNDTINKNSNDDDYEFGDDYDDDDDNGEEGEQKEVDDDDDDDDHNDDVPITDHSQNKHNTRTNYVLTTNNLLSTRKKYKLYQLSIIFAYPIQNDRNIACLSFYSYV